MISLKENLSINCLIYHFTFFAITVFAAVQVFHNQNKYESVLAHQMFEDTNFIAYISSFDTHKKPGEKQYVEVFDIKEGKVILQKYQILRYKMKSAII